MSDDDQVWTAVAQLLRAQVSEAVWFSTFQDVDAARQRRRRRCASSAPNAHVRDRILTRYLPLVRDALEEIGAANRSIRRRRAGRPTPRRAREPDRSDGRQTHGTPRRPVEQQRHDSGRHDADRSSTPAASTRATRSRRSSRARPTSSPWPRRCASPRRRRAATTRCSSTAPPGWARPTCCTPSGTTSTSHYQHHRSATSAPRRS